MRFKVGDLIRSKNKHVAEVGKVVVISVGKHTYEIGWADDPSVSTFGDI